MQYGLLTRKAKTSPLAKMFNNIEMADISIKKEGTRWVECADGPVRFRLARTVLRSKKIAMYSLLINVAEQKVHVTRVGTFLRHELAQIALNRGKISCSSHQRQKRRTEGEIHVQCPAHPDETCYMNLKKNICASREMQHGMDREYFIVHRGKLEFAGITWWR
jgi:hypothetical protein